MQIKQWGILIGEWGEDLLKINTTFSKVSNYIKCEEIISINFSPWYFSFVALFSDKFIIKLSITDKLTKSCVSIDFIGNMLLVNTGSDNFHNSSVEDL